VRRAIEDRDYGVQRRLYAEARDLLEAFVSAGQVFAWNEDGGPAAVLAEERELLAEIGAHRDWQWWWLFYQLRCDDVGAERAPIVVPKFHAPAGEIWERAGEKIEKALAGYREFRDRFGLSTPWAVVEQGRELTDEDVKTRIRREYQS
jgi:hypothetical protein